MASSVTPSEINLVDADLFARSAPHDLWRILRQQAPVHWNEGAANFPRFWSITKYDDVMLISRDPATFISGKGITMMTNPDVPDQAAGLGKMMIVTDPPRHVRLRRLVNKGFTPRMIAALEPHIRQTVTEILDDVAPTGACD